jgi:hypothetical protein
MEQFYRRTSSTSDEQHANARRIEQFHIGSRSTPFSKQR